MGVDWIRRTEEKFRHSLQEAMTNGLAPAALFEPEEEMITTYPCHWLHEDRTLPLDTRLTVFQKSDQSRVAVLHGSEAIAEIRGEAARDLKQLFKDCPQMCDCLAVFIVKVGLPSEPFYVQPVKKAKRGKASR
jgi:hypothetical protein